MSGYVARHPAFNYAKYLYLTQESCEREELNETLALIGLAPFSAPQYEQLQEEMGTPPAGFSPWNPSHTASTRWLRQKKIYSLVHRDENIQAMFQVLGTPRLREAVERMLLGNVSHAEIAFRVRGLGWGVPEQAVADFRHYFWNAPEMGLPDWTAYFASDDRGRTKAIDNYKTALTGGSRLALYRSGVEVEVDRKKALLEIYKELYFTFREVRTLPTSLKKVEMLANLSRSIARVDERIEAGDTALQDVLKKFEKFRVIGDTDVLPTAATLVTSGSLSDSRGKRLLANKERGE